MAFELPTLPYPHNALEPHIDTRTMEIHHGKHHQAYTNNLNAAIEKHPELESTSANDLLVNLNTIPDDILGAVRNNGGGFVNHSMFWISMSPDGGGEPSGALAEAINAAFGDFESFKTTFSSAAMTRFGSGWGWLCKTGDGSLKVISTANQDNPLSDGLTPLLGLDVWEHAYYLNYQNRRGDYIAAFFNVIDWDEISRRFAA